MKTAIDMKSPISPFQIPKLESLGTRQNWTELHGSASALAIANAATEWNKPIILITSGNRESEELEAALEFYASVDPQLKIYNFPSWECLPYDEFSPHQDITSQRMKLLNQLPLLGKAVVVVSVDNLMQRLPPIEYVESNSFVLKVGQSLDFNLFRARLENTSYDSVNQVERPGDYVIRGGVIDVFPMGSDEPIRIELFGDEIDSLRIFDVDTQLTKQRINELQILPASEIPITDSAIRSFRQGMRRHFEGDPRQNFVYKNIDTKKVPNGAEFYLPLFYDHTFAFLDYVPSTAVIVILDSVHSEAEKFWQHVHERYEATGDQLDRLPLPTNLLYLSPNELDRRIDTFPNIYIGESEQQSALAFNTVSIEESFQRIQTKTAQAALKKFLSESRRKVLFAVDSYAQREILEKILFGMDMNATRVESWNSFLDSKMRFGVTVARLTAGVNIPCKDTVIITQSELFGSWHPTPKAKKKIKSSGSIIESYEELETGDVVVHETYGIGRYQGLVTMSINDTLAEFLSIEYRGNETLYVPVYAFDCVSRYFGSNADEVKIHSLSSRKWKKSTAKARSKAFDIASELLEIQVLRDSHEGNVMLLPEQDYELFVSRFPYRETLDQLSAIQAVLADLASKRPMNRLVCGDVGFGKTEVALRAALVAVANGYQVALVVPTTLLAQQHFDVFRERFADLGVGVELLSRMQKKRTVTRILNALKSNQADIVIGTHRLLQKDIEFSNLGLLIIDEEHRFGVRQKEHLKKLRTSVDILTLTATPIPRTLSMALHDICDISIIGTPPDNRLSVRTFVRDWNSKLIREACLREIGRGGQIIFLHNEVKTITRTAKQLERIVPEAKIKIAHGQMPRLQLQAVMKDFYQQNFDTLVCTTIIENGIDIPSANTIIINFANKFGLAQLHQLRGRVGRSHHQAYAYMLVRDLKYLPRNSRLRLEAIESFDQLGVGYVIATHDLEIRGAGTLLGEAQSGAIDDVGYSLYSRYLEEAVATINQHASNGVNDEENKRRLQQNFVDFEVGDNSNIDIDLQIPALIPESWIPSVSLRLALYKRIANAADSKALNELRKEMIDRFGAFPDSVINLFTIGNLRLRSKRLGVRRLHLSQFRGRIAFVEQPKINFAGIHRLLEEYPGGVKLSSSDSEISFSHHLLSGTRRVSSAIFILDCLDPNAKNSIQK